MYHRSYPGDPYWIKAKYKTKCKCCGTEIKVGEDAYYFPKTKAVFCDGEGCGKKEYSGFRAIAEDEEMYMSSRSNY